ncbi:protocadherin gamma-B1-like [Saccoglossus kowalevskii]
MVTDSGVPPLNATTTIVIPVTDENDNAPTISAAQTSLTVQEHTPNGTEVAYVMAEDKDIGDNAMVTFTLEGDGGMFTIDETSGSIQISNDLDREQVDRYTLTVVATNGGTIAKSSEPLTFSSS